MTSCWFKEHAAEHLLARVAGYLGLLDKYDIPWVKVRSDNPGVIIYDDDVQIVAWHTG